MFLLSALEESLVPDAGDVCVCAGDLRLASFYFEVTNSSIYQCKVTGSFGEMTLLHLFFTIHFFNFIIHQRKGGIHAIDRSIMDAFGYYRVTGPLQKIIC